MAARPAPIPFFPLKRSLSELLGTFVLTFAVLAALAPRFPLPAFLVAAFTLMVMAYVLGPVSGAHCNPAVSIGLFSTNKLSFRETVFYVLSQLIGGFLAMALMLQIINPRFPTPRDTVNSIIGELLGTFILAFGVSMVVERRVDPAASGLVVGSSLFVGAAIASVGSAGVINPAVGLGLGLFDPRLMAFGTNILVYLIVPIIGGVVGAQVARWFSEE